MTDFGHIAEFIGAADFIAHIDSWSAGPFMFRIDGRRVFFEDSDRFGPSVLRMSDWNPSDRQPGEKSRFWDAYGMWRKMGRPIRGKGRVKVAVWREPKPGLYWKDEKTGLSHFLSEPDLPAGPYRRVQFCRKCNVPMIEGQALVQTCTAGTPDFPGADVVTLSPGGPSSWFRAGSAPSAVARKLRTSCASAC